MLGYLVDQDCVYLSCGPGIYYAPYPAKGWAPPKALNRGGEVGYICIFWGPRIICLNGSNIFYAGHYMLYLLEINMHSSHKLYANNGSHKLTACYIVYCTYKIRKRNYSWGTRFLMVTAVRGYFVFWAQVVCKKTEATNWRLVFSWTAHIGWGKNYLIRVSTGYCIYDFYVF